MSETRLSMFIKSDEQNPGRTPRRMNPASRCRSTEVVKPHQACIYRRIGPSSLATTTDLYTDWSAVSHKPWARSNVSAYKVCEHLLTILVMWSLTDSLFEMVTPSILMVDVWLMPDSRGGWLARYFFIPSVITISTVLERVTARLFSLLNLSMLSSSSDRLSTLLAGTMRYVSSAYLASRLPGLNGVRSTALTSEGCSRTLNDTRVSSPNLVQWVCPKAMMITYELVDRSCVTLARCILEQPR